MITIQEIREAMKTGQEETRLANEQNAKKWIIDEVLPAFFCEALSTGASKAYVCIPHNINYDSAIKVFEYLGYKVTRLDRYGHGYNKNKAEYEQLSVRWDWD